MHALCPRVHARSNALAAAHMLSAIVGPCRWCCTVLCCSHRVVTDVCMVSCPSGAQFEDLLDDRQVARSRVRMNAKDADMYDPQTTMGFLKQLEAESNGNENTGWWPFGSSKR